MQLPLPIPPLPLPPLKLLLLMLPPASLASDHRRWHKDAVESVIVIIVPANVAVVVTADMLPSQFHAAAAANTRGSSSRVPANFFSGGKPEFSKLLKDQKKRQTASKERPIF
jgi:hypothetical protein